MKPDVVDAAGMLQMLSRRLRDDSNNDIGVTAIWKEPVLLAHLG